jgi:hypothetical protein
MITFTGQKGQGVGDVIYMLSFDMMGIPKKDLIHQLIYEHILNLYIYFIICIM